MNLYFSKTSFGGLNVEEGSKKGLFIFGGLLPWKKSEGKICWTYEQGKRFVVKIKKMWKDSKFKDFTLFV